MSQEYECLVPIDHTADHCIYPAGSIIKLAHLSADKVKLLVDRGYVTPVKAKVEVKAEAEQVPVSEPKK
jgi:hypothetical protein